jgi:hypothetical protein
MVTALSCNFFSRFAICSLKQEQTQLELQHNPKKPSFDWFPLWRKRAGTNQATLVTPVVTGRKLLPFDLKTDRGQMTFIWCCLFCKQLHSSLVNNKSLHLPYWVVWKSEAFLFCIAAASHGSRHTAVFHSVHYGPSQIRYSMASKCFQLDNGILIYLNNGAIITEYNLNINDITMTFY